MTGTVKKRGRVYWLDVSSNGKRERVSLGTRDRALAEERANEYRAAIVEAAAPRPRTLDDEATTWRKIYLSNQRTSHAQKVAAGRYRNHIAPFIGGKEAGDITATDLWTLRSALEEKELAPRMICNILADLRCLLRFIKSIGVTVPEWPGRIMPKIAERVPNRLTEDHVDRILADSDPGVRWTIAFLLETGLRKSELSRLTWADVQDLPHPRLVLGQTKSGKVRRVPMTEIAQELLRERKGASYPAPIRDRALSNLCLGRDWHLHQLRHTFACRFLDAGGRIEALSELLGHSDLKTTQIYGRLSDEAIRDAVASYGTVMESRKLSSKG